MEKETFDIYKDKHGNKHTVRNFVIKNNEIFMRVLIGTESMEKVVDDNTDENVYFYVPDKIINLPAKNVYFYVPDKIINLPAKKIAENHLDKEFELVEG